MTRFDSGSEDVYTSQRCEVELPVTEPSAVDRLAGLVEPLMTSSYRLPYTPVRPGTVVIYLDGVFLGADNSTGSLREAAYGPDVGRVDYKRGTISLRRTDLVERGDRLRINYEYDMAV